ncbi:MAG: hypothetical protein HZB13_06380 [Acidobacteria bacterium]|nr:hypothetical protein [Acidobacteriota bacterium]
MSSKIITITSAEPGSGKTHVAAALSRWLYRHGYQVAPMHLGPQNGDPVACPEGGTVSRAAALLAEACGLAPAVEYEAGLEGLKELQAKSDWVVVEAPAGASDSGVGGQRRAGRIEIGGLGELPQFEPYLMPSHGAETAALPLWTLLSGPRVGVVSLPHIDNFKDYSLIRGAEWLAGPGVGRFGVLLLPATSAEESDRAWLQDTGLERFLLDQTAAGARLVSSGMNLAGAERFAPGALSDFRVVSAVLGRRMPPPLPDEETLDRLAEWLQDWPAFAEFRRKYM